MKKITLIFLLVCGFVNLGLTGCGTEGNTVVQPTNENELTPEQQKAYEEDQMKTFKEYREKGV